MKKILVILNAGHFPQHVISSAIDIAKKSSSFIYAVFLNDLKTSPEFDYPFPNDLALAGTNVLTEQAKLENRKRIESELQVFKDGCDVEGIPFSFEIDEVTSVSHLLHISSFSDLIMADARSDSDEYSIKDILIGAHAPVLLVSREWKSPEKIILCYDGKLSSIYAIKIFSYVFPEWTGLPAKIIYVTSKQDEQLPHEGHFQNWINHHFSNLESEILHGNAEEQIVNYIHPDSEGKIVVMGSYGEHTLSRIFHTSLSNAVRTQTYASLFITHE
ncbi:universal stress protein [Chitinophagaceae bacterium LB-8]|uniref:Universal stress protein n=1 Tax=Paraflavisolibacter caeni TaxID=2982496 RepID=A0A9X2XZE5_9BACT|nr:universal stress protein [Paraflavisolibacter caeni]MCU7551725.1 universal stress protein [Paraflavisolibacter caeni]